jgi:hypothetical protein
VGVDELIPAFDRIFLATADPQWCDRRKLPPKRTGGPKRRQTAEFGGILYSNLHRIYRVITSPPKKRSSFVAPMRRNCVTVETFVGWLGPQNDRLAPNRILDGRVTVATVAWSLHMHAYSAARCLGGSRLNAFRHNLRYL